MPQSSLRLVAQDVALSRRKQGFESPRERQGLAVRFPPSQIFLQKTGGYDRLAAILAAEL